MSTLAELVSPPPLGISLRKNERAWHYTPARNLPKIMRAGELRPMKGSAWQRPCIFFTTMEQIDLGEGQMLPIMCALVDHHMPKDADGGDVPEVWCRFVYEGPLEPIHELPSLLDRMTFFEPCRDTRHLESMLGAGRDIADEVRRHGRRLDPIADARLFKFRRSVAKSYRASFKPIHYADFERVEASIDMGLTWTVLDDIDTRRRRIIEEFEARKRAAGINPRHMQ